MQKIIKCKDLNIEIQGIWNVKKKKRVIPVIVEATGTIRKSSRKFLSNIPGRHKVKESQIAAILGTSHTVREVLV